MKTMLLIELNMIDGEYLQYTLFWVIVIFM